MNDLRRKLILVGGMAAIPMATGCFTSALVQDATTPDRTVYAETVSSILVSGNGKALVVVGEKYHYIFDAPESVKATLQSDFRKIVEVGFDRFVVDTSQRITGTYRLRIDKNAPGEQKEKALAAGFKALPTGELVASGSVTGQRYAANGIQPTDASQKLQKEYQVSIAEEKALGAKPAKLLLTPITIAVDGVLFLAAIPLLALVAFASQR